MKRIKSFLLFVFFVGLSMSFITGCDNDDDQYPIKSETGDNPKI